MMKTAVFLDKDGTLVPDIPYNCDPGLITVSENALEGLRQLQEQNYALIVISNQPGVALGYVTEEMVRAAAGQLRRLLAEAGVFLTGFYYCPHHAGGIIQEYAAHCFCRKPAPGMLLHAAMVHDIDLSHSWMVGDILNDVEAGNRAGCKTIFLDNGNETEWIGGALRAPTCTCHTINEAAESILNRQYA